MYVDPFAMGIIVTILVELALAIGYSILHPDDKGEESE